MTACAWLFTIWTCSKLIVPAPPVSGIRVSWRQLRVDEDSSVDAGRTIVNAPI
jgi:hypothetical protein